MEPCDNKIKQPSETFCIPDNDQEAGPQGLHTEFLPAERYGREELLRQKDLLFKDSHSRLFFDGFPDGGFILNDKRQIIAVNRAIGERFKTLSEESVFGLRPGEALGCTHAQESPGGCGTTRFCRYCGAAKVLYQVRMSKSAQEQCHIVTKIETEALSLLIWGTPFKASGVDFTLFAVADISPEQRRQALERIFFHDVLNTVNGLLGAVEIFTLKATPDIKPWVQNIHMLSHSVAGEIKDQRQLMLAESGALTTNYSKLLSNDLLKSVAQNCSQMSAAANRIIEMHPDNQEFALNSDVSLIRRIMTNLVKNAVEASKEGEKITLKASQLDDAWTFSVHNNAFIPVDDQHNLYKRSFSTKGQGHGLGLYSVRLLTEKYLKGSVTFESDPNQGTTFTITLPRE